MTLTPSNLFMNTLDLGFMPGGSGSASPLAKITKTALNMGVSMVKFAGDGDAYYTFETAAMQEPSLQIEGGSVSGIVASVAGATGTLTWKWPDAKNGVSVGGGGLSFSMENAVVSDIGASASHAQIASGNITFTAFSSDGTTNPVTFTVL